MVEQKADSDFRKKFSSAEVVFVPHVNPRRSQDIVFVEYINPPQTEDYTLECLFNLLNIPQERLDQLLSNDQLNNDVGKQSFANILKKAVEFAVPKADPKGFPYSFNRFYPRQRRNPRKLVWLQSADQPLIF